MKNYLGPIQNYILNQCTLFDTFPAIYSDEFNQRITFKIKTNSPFIVFAKSNMKIRIVTYVSF
jgi:hypothetical protein